MTGLKSTITEDEFVEQVWANLCRMLAADPSLRLQDLAALTPYSKDALFKFRSRERRSVRVASTLANVLPQLMDGLRCDTCGRLPNIIYN